MLKLIFIATFVCLISNYTLAAEYNLLHLPEYYANIFDLLINQVEIAPEAKGQIVWSILDLEDKNNKGKFFIPGFAARFGEEHEFSQEINDMILDVNICELLNKNLPEDTRLEMKFVYPYHPFLPQHCTEERISEEGIFCGLRAKIPQEKWYTKSELEAIFLKLMLDIQNKCEKYSVCASNYLIKIMKNKNCEIDLYEKLSEKVGVKLFAVEDETRVDQILVYVIGTHWYDFQNRFLCVN